MMGETELVPSKLWMDRIQSLEQRLTALEGALANQYVLNKYFIKTKQYVPDVPLPKNKERKGAE